MISYSILAFSQSSRGTISAAQMMRDASLAVTKIFGHHPKEKPWHQDKENPFAFSNNVYIVYFSRKEYGRISSIDKLAIRDRMRNGPKQGELFDSSSQWEEFGFKHIQRLWTDIDGYVSDFRKTGEVAYIAAGRKSWASDSNTIGITWFTHPVRGLQRQFDVLMEMGTGELLSIRCGGFTKAPADWNQKKNVYIKLDNSKKRKTKVGQPPAR